MVCSLVSLDDAGHVKLGVLNDLLSIIIYECLTDETCIYV